MQLDFLLNNYNSFIGKCDIIIPIYAINRDLLLFKTDVWFRNNAEIRSFSHLLHGLPPQDEG